MMERHEHTNPWADKLQDVQLPDANASWSAMAVLLDKEMPVLKQPNRRRWLLLIILLLLLIGVCNCPRRRATGDVDSRMTDTGSRAKGEAGFRMTDTGSQATDVSSRTTDIGSRTTGVGSGTQDTGSRVTDTVLRTTDVVPRKMGTVLRQTDISKQGTTNTGARKTRGDKIKGNKPDPAPAPGSKTRVRNGIRTAVGKGVRGDHAGVADNSGGDSVDTDGLSIVESGSRPSGDTVTSANKGKGGKDSVAVAAPKPAQKDGLVKKPAATPVNKKTPAADSTQKETERGLVAGIGFNQFFSVGQQQKSDYNSGGTSGGLGDYLPVPMLRYYFSRKLYVQLEAQFNTPQYTKKNLVAGQSTGDTLPSGHVQQNSVTIQKLFYFNLPLSVHYSPVKNLYLGAGLQYSRLSNGVGLYQDKVLVTGGPDSVKAAKVYSFKGDSIYRKIRTNELRFLLDINYNYKKIIVGARYNQALSKFLDVHISNTQVTQARNSSLQLYVRYILWDNRKKNKSSSK